MIDADGVEWRFGEYVLEGPPGLAQVNLDMGDGGKVRETFRASQLVVGGIKPKEAFWWRTRRIYAGHGAWTIEHEFRSLPTMADVIEASKKELRQFQEQANV
jgi:hypothetical protein